METGKELVISTNFNGDISKAIQKTTSLTKIRPKNRIVINGSMYSASCVNLKLLPEGFQGALRLTFYEEIKEEKNESHVKSNLAILVLNKFFLKDPNKPDLVYKDKKYRTMWCSRSNEYPTWITLNNKVASDILGKMKIELLNDRELLISNQFLSTIFSPIILSLLELHSTFGRF